MGEINTSAGNRGDKHIKRKILSTRVDLTPMVDLGFLLITFFIFTTKMGEPKSMKLKLPDDHTRDSAQTAEGKTLNLIMDSGDKLWYYPGTALDDIRHTDYASGLRNVIHEKREQIKNTYGNGNELVILIKPSESSSYRNVVDVLDEMVISQVSRYIMVDLNANEKNKLTEAISSR